MITIREKITFVNHKPRVASASRGESVLALLAHVGLVATGTVRCIGTVQPGDPPRKRADAQKDESKDDTDD